LHGSRQTEILLPRRLELRAIFTHCPFNAP
jgi:hypothetical protein